MGEELGVTPEDWANPDSEWEPLPLDRESEELEVAIREVDNSIREIEQSNGYAAQLPRSAIGL